MSLRCPKRLPHTPTSSLPVRAKIRGRTSLPISGSGHSQPRYDSRVRTLAGVPPIRRDLIRRPLYLVPNSIVVTRGCPHVCDFCYKEAFFQGGRSFYTQRVDDALAEIERLPGHHLIFSTITYSAIGASLPLSSKVCAACGECGRPPERSIRFWRRGWSHAAGEGRRIRAAQSVRWI